MRVLLTPWYLPHASLPNAEVRVPYFDHDPTVKDEEYHLHLPRILEPFDATRWKVNHSRTKKG